MLKNLTISKPVYTFFRNLETLTSKCLKYTKFGKPAHVLEMCEEKIDKPENKQVVVKVLAAPINPSDIKTILGKYPVVTKFPAIGGNECVGEIISVGEKVKNLKVGDRVIATSNGLGTWRSIAKYKEQDLMKISNTIGIPEAATLNMNTCTAYRLLKDFVQLKPGDTVIQNGAHTAVGQTVHQLCRIWDIQSVGIVRNSNNVCEMKSYLMSLGATSIITEDELISTDIFDTRIPRPLLGLNAVGGRSVTSMSYVLGEKGILVTYGGRFKKPVNVPNGLLIYKDISLRGFWITRWTKENYLNVERQHMFDELCVQINCGSLKAPLNELIPLEKYKEAIKGSIEFFKGFSAKKYILEMHKIPTEKKTIKF